MHAPAEDAMVEAIRRGDVRDRMLWAGLAAITGAAGDGTTDGMLQRLEAACRTFAVPSYMFDQLAAKFDFHYYRPGDCYLSRQGLVEARRIDALMLH
jgi:hypothetical protein